MTNKKTSKKNIKPIKKSIDKTKIKTNKTKAHSKKKNKTRLCKKPLYYSIIALILILLTALSSWYFLYKNSNTKIAEESDQVAVYYVGSFENGTIFDTNIASRAKAAGLFNPERSYVPLEFRIGSNQVVKGFEEAVIGMKIGDSKIVTLSPDQAYGEVKESSIVDLPLIDKSSRLVPLNRYFDIPKSALLKSYPEAEVGFVFQNQGLDYEVVGESNDTYKIKFTPKIGDSIPVPDVAWNGTVLSVNNSVIIVRQDPELNGVYQTRLAPVKIIELTNDSIKAKLMLREGDYLKTQYGTGIITEVTNESAKIDFNHPLAGKTLVFEIQLVNITKAPSNLNKQN